MLSPKQFQQRPTGDPGAKEALLAQLRPDFPERALAWINDPQVTVQAPRRVDANSLEWDNFADWRASHELKAVNKIAKKLKKGKQGKPALYAQRPGEDELLIIDGHHHTMAWVDLDQDPVGYVAYVPSRNGPWDTMHDKESGDKDNPDFKGEPDRDSY